MTKTEQIFYQVVKTLKQELKDRNFDPIAEISLKAEITDLFQENYDPELIEDRLLDILEEADLSYLSTKIKEQF